MTNGYKPYHPLTLWLYLWLKAAESRNYEALKEDDDFKVLVQQYAQVIAITKGFYEDILVNTKDLIDDLELEIERLEWIKS